VLLIVPGEIVGKQGNSAIMALGMFCHKKFIKLLKMETDSPSSCLGRFSHIKIGDVSSWGRIVQGTYRCKNGGDGLSWRRIVRVPGHMSNVQCTSNFSLRVLYAVSNLVVTPTFAFDCYSDVRSAKISEWPVKIAEFICMY
jgi:hypothetical protein